MKSTYPFDPYDWTTITPLLDALSDMPVSDDGFMDWLAQWNELDIDVWDAYTQLKRHAYVDTSDHDAEAAVARQSVPQLYLGFASVVCVMQDAFEHWLYGEAPEDVIPADLDAKWLELKKRFEPWDDDYASEAEKMTGWQRNTWSLFRMPLYMITYPMAMVGTCQLGRLVQTDRARVINNYKAALALGNTQALPELFGVVGLAFPFAEQAVEEAIKFVFDQWTPYLTELDSNIPK